MATTVKEREIEPTNQIRRFTHNDGTEEAAALYDVSGKGFLYKIFKRSEGAEPSLVGYADLKYTNLGFIPGRKHIVPSSDRLSSYNYKHGYFQTARPKELGANFVIRRQAILKEDDGKEIIRERNYPHTFVRYETPLTNNEIDKRNRELKEKKLKELNEFVRKYQLNSNDSTIRATIGRRIHLWPRLEREVTVFRGQQNPMVQEVRSGTKDSFFSTSLDDYISSFSFTSKTDGCCLFVLHLQPGVQYYSLVGDITTAIQNYNARREREKQGFNKSNNLAYNDERYGWEEEVLVAGGGQFFQDKQKTKAGFREVTFDELTDQGIVGYWHTPTNYGPKTHTKNGERVTQKTGVFEAYYFPPSAKGGTQKRRGNQKTKKQKKSKRRVTRKRTF